MWRLLSNSILVVLVWGIGVAFAQRPPTLALPGSEAGEPRIEELVRCRAVADAWVSDATAQERNTSAGKSPRLKIKNIQEMALIRFDMSLVVGREVQGAVLFLHRDSPDQLRYLRISTVNQDWVEGEGVGDYGPPDGASYLFADASPRQRRPWAWPGSCLADVIMSSGNSYGCWAERKELAEGWIAVTLTPPLIYAMAIGDSDGLAVMDGGNPANANNYISSTQSRGFEPYLEVRLGGRLNGRPATPKATAEPARERSRLGSGAVHLTIEPAENVFCWRMRLGGRPVERWRIKHPASQGATEFFLEDLEPAAPHELEIVAVSKGGEMSPPARVRFLSSPAVTTPEPLGSLPPPELHTIRPLEKGALRVWAIPGLVKISPTDARVLGNDLLPHRIEGSSASTTNCVWDGASIALFGARGEYVSCQLCLENLGGEPVDNIRIKRHMLRGPDDAVIGIDHIELYQNWYAKNQQGRWQPAYCIPMDDRPLGIPDPVRKIPGQRNQTIYVDIHIPQRNKPGAYRGSLVVQAKGEIEIEVPLTLEVFSFTLRDHLSFWPELNTYRIPEGATEYYRLAHQHRCVLNCWGWRPSLAGAGRNIRVDWTDYDRQVGPLLTGDAFANNRRSGVPIECMYLPFTDSWPTPLGPQTYHYRGYWPKQGDDIRFIVEHYMTAPYLGAALSQEYKQAFLSVQRQFIEHFQKKGYSQTEMQCFFGGKATHRIEYGTNMWWTTDEPYFWDDWLALQFFLYLWTSGRGQADPRLWTARADISRPQWQGRTLNGIIDAAYFGAGGFTGPDNVRRCRILSQETGLNARAYGSTSPDTASNTQNVAALVTVWCNGADGFLPWQTLGSDASLDENAVGDGGGAALLVPGGRFHLPVVADMRLKALRDGEQLIEYLTLLAERRKWTREQIKAVILEAVLLESQSHHTTRLDDAAAVTFNTLPAWQLAGLRWRIATLLTSK